MVINKVFLDQLEYKVTGACIEINRILGPGLLESVYKKCLMRELQLQNINFTAEHPIVLSYKDVLLNTELKVDLVIENCLVIELKAVERILPIHEAQILTYMKLLKIPKGLLINFNSTNIVHNGKKSFVNEFMYDINP
ncbi:GxxExxY protein [Pedobacter riviphilus]|uniref:GxxExxY protein n=1 Tax=Pedobacter riviphilus TaxID=2766984 RepID=A0ABX6TN57_9SPHI|nr:GxxExxY protein [Pedobacter riviphilus]QNR86941.1 GxxExxY protein [Pedobacter riviphilus]